MKEVTISHGTLSYRAVMLTDVGRRRTENQDSFGYGLAKNGSLFVVADGMGGARGGGTASAMAVHLILDNAFASDGCIDLKQLEPAISRSNRVIFTRSQEESQLNGMGTTVVAIGFVGDRAIIAHVGDSRIYRLRDRELVQLTRDHTLVQELVDSGAIQPEDAATHPIAHMLTRSLGPMASIGVETSFLDDSVLPGDLYLLCSDGLYNHCPREVMERALSGKTIQQAGNALMNLALENGGTDNITVQIIEAMSGELAAPASTPSNADASNTGSDGVERFVNSEIDVSKINSQSLVDYARSADSPSAHRQNVPSVDPALSRKESSRREKAAPREQSVSSSTGTGAGVGDASPVIRETIVGSHEGLDVASLQQHAAADLATTHRSEPNKFAAPNKFTARALPDSTDDVPDLDELGPIDEVSDDAFHRHSGQSDAHASGDHSATHRSAGHKHTAQFEADEDDIHHGFFDETGSGGLDAYGSSEHEMPRWWSTFLAAGLTLVFAGVFYLLLQHDLFTPREESVASAKSAALSGSSRKAKDRQQQQMTTELFEWAPGTEPNSTPPPASSESATPSGTPSNPVTEVPSANETTAEVPTGMLSTGMLPTASDPGTGAPVSPLLTSGTQGVDPTKLPEASEIQVVKPGLPTTSDVTPPIDFDAVRRAADERVNRGALAEQVSLASSFQIPNAPRLRLGGGTPTQPTEPIQWEEAKRVSAIAKVVENGGRPLLLTDAERRDVAEEKRKVREKISDLDVKLEMLVIENAQDAKTRRVRSEMEATRATEAGEAIQNDIEATRGLLADWESIRAKAAGVPPMTLLGLIAAHSSDVREAAEVWKAADAKYEKTVESWQKNPSEPSSSTPAELAALGRDRKVREAELEALLVSELHSGPERTKQRLARLQHDLRAVELRRDLLNRHIGMLRAFVPATIARRQILQDQYLEERLQNLNRLRELQAKLSDQDEARFRLEHIDLFTGSAVSATAPSASPAAGPS